MTSIQYRPDISTGNIITIVTALVLAAGSYFASNERLKAAEKNIESIRIDLRISQQEAYELRIENATFVTRLNSMDQSMKDIKSDVKWLVQREKQKGPVK